MTGRGQSLFSLNVYSKTNIIFLSKRAGQIGKKYTHVPWATVWKVCSKYGCQGVVLSFIICIYNKSFYLIFLNKSTDQFWKQFSTKIPPVTSSKTSRSDRLLKSTPANVPGLFTLYVCIENNKKKSSVRSFLEICMLKMLKNSSVPGKWWIHNQGYIKHEGQCRLW